MISCKIINELTWPMHATPTFRINCFGWLSGFKANLLSCNWRRKLGAQWTRGDVLIRIDDCVQCLYISCAMGQLQTNNRNVELVWKSFDSIPFYLPLLALLSFWRTIFYRHSEDLGEDFSPKIANMLFNLEFNQLYQLAVWVLLICNLLSPNTRKQCAGRVAACCKMSLHGPIGIFVQHKFWASHTRRLSAEGFVNTTMTFINFTAPLRHRSELPSFLWSHFRL